MDVLPVAGEKDRALFRVRLFRLSAVRAIFCGDFEMLLLYWYWYIYIDFGYVCTHSHIHPQLHPQYTHIPRTHAVRSTYVIHIHGVYVCMHVCALDGLPHLHFNSVYSSFSSSYAVI